MIDTIVLTGRLHPEHFGSSLELAPRWRRSPNGGLLEAFDYGPGPWRMSIDSDGTANLRLSIPRLVNRSGLNYPIPPLSAWDMVRTALELLEWVGVAPARRDAAAQALAQRWLTTWGVRSVAFSADAYASDLPDVLRVLSTRKERTPVQTWGGVQPEGIQWNSTRRRVQLYDKAREIENKIPRLLRAPGQPVAGRTARQELARVAHNHIRLEVTLRGAEQVRRLAALPAGYLPTLSWVGRQEVAAFVLTKEARALGLSHGWRDSLSEPWEPCDASPQSAMGMAKGDRCIADRPLTTVRPRASMLELSREIARLSSAVPGGRSKRDAATASRILSAAAFAVVSQHLTREQLRRELRMSDAVYLDQRRFLESLGFHTLGGDGLEDQRRVASFAEELFLEIGGPVDSISAPPRRESSLEGPAQVVVAPYPLHEPRS